MHVCLGDVWGGATLLRWVYWEAAVLPPPSLPDPLRDPSISTRGGRTRDLLPSPCKEPIIPTPFVQARVGQCNQ